MEQAVIKQSTKEAHVGPNSVTTSNDERGKFAFEHLPCTWKKLQNERLWGLIKDERDSHPMDV